MGKTYSTQLKICNDTTSTITTTVSRIKPGDFCGNETPDRNFHQVKIPPDSEYSREQVINLRRGATVFSLEMRFDKDKEPNSKTLRFRIDQGRPADGRRNQCLRSKEKNLFEFSGDENAFDVKDTVSGNTLTIRIKDSYMYEFGDKDEMKMKAVAIAAEQRMAAETAVAKAEALKRAKEAKRREEEAKAREHEVLIYDADEESGEENGLGDGHEESEDESGDDRKAMMVEVLRLAEEKTQERMRGENERARNDVNLNGFGLKSVENMTDGHKTFSYSQSVNDNNLESAKSETVAEVNSIQAVEGVGGTY